VSDPQGLSTELPSADMLREMEALESPIDRAWWCIPTPRPSPRATRILLTLDAAGIRPTFFPLDGG